MNIFVEPELVLEGGEPVSCQLQGQIRSQILQGVLRPGEELPTVRSVAVGLSVNPHAVEAAYEQLEREGFLSRGEGCGPHVAPPSAGTGSGNLDNICREFLRQTAAEGYSLAEVLQALHAWIDRSHGHG